MTLVQSATAAPSAPVVAAICAAEILGLAGFSIVPALLPQFIKAWSLTNTQAGWLAGITPVLNDQIGGVDAILFVSIPFSSGIFFPGHTARPEWFLVSTVVQFFILP